MEITTFFKIIEKLEKIFNTTKSIDIANKLDLQKGNYSKKSKSKEIPYKNVVECCIKNNIDLNEIFENKVKCKTNKENNELIQLLDKLSDKEKELYIYEIKARILRKEIDK